MRTRAFVTFALTAAGAIVACVGDSPAPGITPFIDSGNPDTSATTNPDTSPPPDSSPPVDSGCGGAATTDFYVDPVAGSDGNTGGGANCALKTISAALIKSDKHANAIIHLGAGKYGQGETFPLVLDQGRSLVGADPTTTTIQGSSTAFSTVATGSSLDTGGTFAKAFVTVVAGDLMGGTNMLGATKITGVTIMPDASVSAPTANYLGVVCVAGNGPNTGVSDPSKLDTPNLVITNATIGPNYDQALLVGSSPMNSSGCNLSITTSTIKGSTVGIRTGSCGTQNPSVAWPAARVGDGKISDANTFTGNTYGIYGAGCGTVQSFAANKFVSGFVGISLNSNPSQYFEVLASTFDGATAPFMGIGMEVGGGSTLSKLNDNTFTNISYTNAANQAVGAAGYAIYVHGYDVTQALRNQVHDNDNGLWVTSTIRPTFSFSATSMNDANNFYCNSSMSNGVGHDVILKAAQTNNSLDIFAFTHFDHSPPSTGANNGDDLVPGTVNVNLVSPGVAAGKACAAGRITGN